MFGNGFNSSASCSGWPHETALGRPDQSLSCRFLKVATHPSRLIGWAQQTGPETGRLVAGILDRRPHPEQGYRACLGLLRLGRQYGADRLETASARALRLKSYSYRTVKNILASRQEQLPFEDTEADPTPHHANIRGAAYYTNHPEEDRTHAD